MYKILFILFLFIVSCEDNGQAPPACLGEYDCLGQCDGVAVVDICGECNGDATATEDCIYYDSDISGIFVTHCIECHDSQNHSSGLDMTAYSVTVSGGNSGPGIVAFDVGSSLVLEEIENGSMPKDEDSLSEDIIQLITDWINQGAKETSESDD